MPENRFYYEGALTGTIVLEGVEHRHLSQVMRQKSGDTVEVVNGKGMLAEALITGTDKRQTRLRVVACEEQAPPAREIILAQALPLMNRLDTIIEKCTELGAGRFWLFAGERSERKSLSGHQLERLKGITIAALKQSGRLWLPLIELLPPIKEWGPNSYTILYGDLNAKETLTGAKENSILIIGPESGLSPNEIEILKKRGAKGVSLHANILRTDTAAIAGMALLS